MALSAASLGSAATEFNIRTRRRENANEDAKKKNSFAPSFALSRFRVRMENVEVTAVSFAANLAKEIKIGGIVKSRVFGVPPGSSAYLRTGVLIVKNLSTDLTRPAGSRVPF
jgi:hypothetical protein